MAVHHASVWLDAVHPHQAPVYGLMLHVHQYDSIRLNAAHQASLWHIRAQCCASINLWPYAVD